MNLLSQVVFCLALCSLANSVQAKCVLRNSDFSVAQLQNDTLYNLLNGSEKCPESAQALKELVKNSGLSVSPAMVANRGRHNPRLGSFSFFEHELNKGEFFFGHFTTVRAGVVSLDQKPSPGKLLIEVIAWDREKQWFNFYELIGKKQGAQWFYRGDTADIVADNTYLHRQRPSNTPLFGQRLRCSGCHVSGGPIMKELAEPHNDWWRSNRPLSLRPNQASQEIQQWLNSVVDANEFSRSVLLGINKLEHSPGYQKLKGQLSLQEQLRPIFCTMEINIESDVSPFGTSSTIQIPSAFFIDPILGNRKTSMNIETYRSLLGEFKIHFPETAHQDADHAWLTPVRGYSDHLAIQSLLKRKVVSEDYVRKVLSYDFENPLFSEKRCALLKQVPFDVEKLKEQPILMPSNPQSMFKKLIQLRIQVFENEISQNPLGQILEPGFRVIFPEAR